MKNLFDRAKLFFSKDREFRSALYDIMGFCPHNIDLYRTAFAHKSQEYRSKKLGNKPLNNERLEFLGDAVLETVVSHIVYRHFPNKREGFLTNTRSKIVSRESLGRLAKELHIDRLIQSQTHSRTHNSYLGGNSFEALMGAIYLDRGFHYAFRFVEKRIIGAVLDLESVASKEVNFKSKLLEWSQKNRIRLEFKDTAADHDKANGPSFLTTVVIEGLYAGEGKGYSKKESHQAAAKDALTKLRREPQFLDGVFRAKEKRTAMGAEEFFVLPKIDEIEAEIAQEQSEGNSGRKEQGRGERNRKDHRGEQRGERNEKRNEKRNERQKDNREEKNAERRNGKNRGEQRNEQSEETPKRNTERKERRNKNAEARKEREGREGREERRQPAEHNNDDHAKKAPVADHQSTEKRNESTQPKEAEVQPAPAPERVEQPKVEVPAPQHEPAPVVQEAPAVETPQTVEAVAEVTTEPAPAPQVTVPAAEEPATTAPQPQVASTRATDQLLPDTPNILPQSDRIEAQGTETPAAVEKSAPAEQTAVFAPMELPAEAVSATQEASAQTSTREVEEQHTTANTAQSESRTPEVPVTAPHSETRAEEVSTVTALEVEPFEASPLDSEVAPTKSELIESELIEIELTETPTPRTEQQKKRARRQNKAQNAAGYTNTTLPPAEQSRRAEKAERKQREEAHRRAVERAHSELAEAPENADEALDAESPAEQPATRRNNRRRRGGARRRKPGRNSEGNGTTQHEGGDN